MGYAYAFFAANRHVADESYKSPAILNSTLFIYYFENFLKSTLIISKVVKFDFQIIL